MKNPLRKIVVQSNYIRVIDPLLMCNTIINTTTGIILDINLTDKIVYSYISHHIAWFTSIGKKMFESQDSIGEAIGVDRKTVGRSVRRLESVGLIVRKKYKAENGLSTIYSIPKLCGDVFKLLAQRITRVKGCEDVVEQVEIIIKDIPTNKPKTSFKKSPMKYKPFVEDDTFECPF